MLLKPGPELGIGQAPSVRAGDHHEIEPCELGLMVPKALPDDAFEPIPADGTAALSDRYGQPQAGSPPVIGPAKHQEGTIAGANRLGEYPLKFLRSSQPRPARKPSG